MAQRPEIGGTPNHYEWASEERQEVVIIGGQPHVVKNKEQPLQEFTTFGLRYGQPYNNQETNYQFDGYSKWVKHLDERYSVGSIHMTRSVLLGYETDAQLQVRLGGTWTLLGTQTIGGATVQLWEKVA